MPIKSIAKFETEKEAIAKANNTEYGLMAPIFTENISWAHRVSAALESGMVTINCVSRATPISKFLNSHVVLGEFSLREICYM